MKKLMLTLALASAIGANANTLSYDVQCDKHDKVLTMLHKDYKENIVWVGRNKELTYVLFSNSSAKTWTFIATDNTNACVLASGQGYVLANPI